MDDKDDKVLLKCVKIIITNSVGADGELIEKIAHCFEANEAISKNQKKKIHEDVDGGHFKEAAERLIESICNGNSGHPWTAILAVSVGDDEFPGDECMKRLLTRLLGGNPVPLEIANLIYSWEMLRGLHEELSLLWKETFSSTPLPSMESFVLEFILQCHLSYQTPAGREVIAECQKSLTVKQNEEIDTEMNTEETHEKVTKSIEVEKVKHKSVGATLTEKEVFACVKASILHFVSLNEEVIQDYAICFATGKLISQSQCKRVIAAIKDGNIGDALKALADLSWKWCHDYNRRWKNLLLSVADEEFPGDRRVASLFKLLAGDKPIAKPIGHLIQSWKEWGSSSIDVLKLVKLTWHDGKEISASDNMWSLLVILRCLCETDPRKVLQFAGEVKKLIHDESPTVSKCSDADAMKESLDASTSAKRLKSESSGEEKPQNHGDVSTVSNVNSQVKNMSDDESVVRKARRMDREIPQKNQDKTRDKTEDLKEKGAESRVRKHIDRKAHERNEDKACDKTDASKEKNEVQMESVSQVKDAEELKSLHSTDTLYIIEFRVVLAEDNSIPFDGVLCMHTNLYGDEWTSVNLKKSESRSYYSCEIPLLRTTSCFQYKYFVKVGSRTIHWEKFGYSIYSRRPYCNRIIIMKDLENQTILHDVASFNYLTESWIRMVMRSIDNHLPPATSLGLRFVQSGEKHFNFMKELFQWFSTIKNGYKLIEYKQRESHLLPKEDLQHFLMKWLENNRRLLDTSTKNDAIRMIFSTLMVAVAMNHFSIKLTERLLSVIFQMLAIHALNESDQKLLYKEIIDECKFHGVQTGTIQNALESLFRAVKENLVVNFLVALPLYWLVVNEGNTAVESVKKTGRGGLLYQRSAIPYVSNMKWSEIRQGFLREYMQRDVLEFLPVLAEIYKTHPWIIGSYQYCLKEENLIKIIENREKNSVGDKFPIDCVLHQLLKACKEQRSTGYIRICELERISDFLICQFETMIADASADRMETGNKDEISLEVPVNILASMTSLLADVARKNDLQTKRSNDELIWCLNITCYVAKLISSLAQEDHKKADLVQINRDLESICTSITNRIHRGRIDENQLMYWNSLMTMEWSDGKFDAIWKERVKNEIKQKIDNEWYRKDEEFISYYAVHLENVSLREPVATCFNEKAFKCTEALLQASGASSFFQRHIFSRIRTPRFVKLFDSLFIHEMQKSKQLGSFNSMTLKFLFSWPFAAQFFKLFYNKDALALFSSTTRERIIAVTKAFVAISGTLISGDILVKRLKLINQNREKFYTLYEVMEDFSVDSNPNYLSRIIDQRMHQLEAFYTAQNHIRGFMSACSKLDEAGEVTVNVNELKEKLIKNLKSDDEMLSKICPGSGNQTMGEQKMSFFQIPTATLKHFQAITFLKDSKVFEHICHGNAVDAKKRAESGFDLGDKGLWRAGWREAVSEIWKSTSEDVMELVQKIDDGNITLEDICEYFEKCQPEEIKSEIKILYEYYGKVVNEKERKAAVADEAKMKAEEARRIKEKKSESSDDESTDDSDNSDDDEISDEENESVPIEVEEMSEDEDQSLESGDEGFEDVKNMKLRTRQLSSYFQLEKAEETINLLLQIRDELHLTGDFTSIELQKDNLESKQSMLHELPDDQKIPFVCTIPKEDVDCLEKFIREKDLIEWLKDRMNDVSEVQVMCDLAMISAGESQYELAVVSCLLSAVMGFAPLIFELDSSDGLDQLLAKCQDVWKNRDSDEKLMEKWRDTGQKLAWFKGIENFHGSVEKHSLSLAQEINKHGVYTIKRESEIGRLDVKDCILLTLPEKNETENTYRLEALCDLQSKLMLIAGEAEMGHDDVTNFVEVLNSIQVLAGFFVKLILAGCMLFRKWSAIIVCDDVTGKNTDNLKIQISFDDDSQPLSGTGSLSDLNKLSSILNQSLERWNNHISAKRSEHYFLNEFNIQQMIYLCHELASIKDGLPDQVGTLLTKVAEYSSIARLQDLLNEATKVRDDVEDEMVVEDNEHEASAEVDKNDAKSRAVRRLMNEEGYDEDVAKGAVQAEGYEDSDACVNWCLLNEFDKDEVSRFRELFDREAGVHHSENEVRVIPFLNYNRAQNSVKEVINRLLEVAGDGSNLINCINTICMRYHDETKVITLRDYLSVEHLGRFLHLLHEDAKKTSLARELAHPFISGRPNLLIRQEQEILESVLRMYTINSDQPLPSASEVLVCSKQTSVDEIERFLRRAMCKCEHKGRPIFTLAFAEKLEFNISTETEKIFNRLSQDAEMDYQLVILLSDPKHYLSTCFDKYLVDGKQVAAGQDIQKYLEDHLKVSDDMLGKSAACADSKHSMVKVVSSTRSGVGKSLHVQRLTEQLERIFNATRTSWDRKTIRLLERTLDLKYVTDRLFYSTTRNSDAMLVHIDLTPAVQIGIDAFVFNLFVLGSIQDIDGKMWKRHPNHLYVLEMTDGGKGKGAFSARHIINLLPKTECYSPREVLQRSADNAGEFLGMDQTEFRSPTFQRPFQYLKMYDEAKGNWSMLDNSVYANPQGSPAECIEVLLRHCCMNNPSWAQLRHFASFLNVQLHNCENSVYCNQNIVGQELPGLKGFAVRFMIRMSQDFATPSLNISDESAGDNDSDEVMKDYQFRRKWEESTHPYLFFNEDQVTMSFINVNISDNGDLLDKNGEITEPGFITKELVNGLKLQRVSLDLNFDTFSRDQKLRILCQVMGIQNVFDPDPTYELTTDNVLKILAIYMRFRCEIPVIIMGETGCGKTRMVEFICKLKSGSSDHEIKSMITLKIHGGITVDNVHESVRKAQEIAEENKTKHQFDTILFYDEANTTEAIYAIKEVMCDLTIDGRSFVQSQLKLVAACNPYKQLSNEAIKKLEDSGLGYRMKTSETSQLFGNVPMRTLVYRVVALPPSMQPFVWDFGQLSDEAERMYIQQMTKRLGQNLGLDRESMRLINAVLSEAQNYMRGRKDECRYVSLRDVERCVTTYEWFHVHKDAIYPLIEEEIKRQCKRMHQDIPGTDENLRTLLLTIGVCYHASLDNRADFLRQMSYAFGLEGMHVGSDQIKEEISAAQCVFLKNMKMDDNIATNEALQENVFMMTVCADMRIPLFLIGKPGSSKSLAKTIVGDNMQGNTSRSPLYKKLKQVHILSYQCSALTDAAGIESVFKQCAQLQADQDLKSYTAVVVLDEIGLAEDSENMPLKVLHPLLECGSTNNTSLIEFDAKKKVGFVGISNWALDPAKMNRGIFVTRSKPTKDDLKKTAKGIFENRRSKINENSDLLDKLTDSYMEVYKAQTVEYFGLRDYYSLIKMIHRICTATKDANLTPGDVSNAIHRNFSGGKEKHFEKFRTKVQYLYHDELMSNVSIQKMILDNLKEKDSRFLLLLTNHFSASSLLHLCLDDFENSVQVIFGSSFKGDHNYTDICRNINRIKVCMETGKTVVLLNMTEIHESLYDALNQHYVTFGGHRYVDLGLGGHRVKCRIAENFRLIVIEQKEVVYEKYPIPLINRLEKHHLDSKSLLSQEQRASSDELAEWANQCTSIEEEDFTCKDAFLGYHEDTISSVVLAENTTDENVHKAVLLQSATMDAIFRLPESRIGAETESIQELYLHRQTHDSLLSLLKESLKSEMVLPLLEVVSFSNILSESDRQEIERELDLQNSVMLLSLEQFQTEHEYSNKLDEFFNYCDEDNARVLLIQCSQAQSEYHGQLIACARYCLSNKMKEKRNTIRGKAIVALLLSTEREGESQHKSGSLLLQHVGDNQIIYVDELRPTSNDIAPASHFYKKSLCDILQLGAQELKGERSEASLIKILSLLRDCVLEAVTKVKCRLSKSERYFKRIKIMSEIFADGNEIGSHFRNILLEKMIALYSGVDENSILQRDWIVGEACNRDSLQEGGTFRKTLWLCLKNHISKVLGYVISITDRQDNLDLLLETEEGWKINMWLEIFKCLPLSWLSLSRAQEFLIRSPPQHKETVPCNVPFSFELHDFFINHWETLSQQITLYLRQSFFGFFRRSLMFRTVANALAAAKIAKLMKLYAEDLVKYSYIPGTGESEETETIKDIVYEIAMKQIIELRNDPEYTRGDELALVFVTYKEQSICLDILSEIFRTCPELLGKAKEWINQWRESENQSMIYISAFLSLLELLEENAGGLNYPKLCLEWKLLMGTTRRIFNKLIVHVNNQEEKDKILKKWIPLNLVFLAIDQLLPRENSPEFERYVAVISPHVKLLWRGAVGNDVRTHRTLRVTCNVLRKMYEDIKLKHLIEWEDMMCKLCKKKMERPISLQCGHFVCDNCVRALTTGGGRCSTCNAQFLDDLTQATLDDEQRKEVENFQSICTSFFLEYLKDFCFSSCDYSEMIPMAVQVKTLISEFVVDAPVERREYECSAIDKNINLKASVLRIVLDHSPDPTRNELNVWLGNENRNLLENLVTVVLKCFENQILLDAKTLSDDRMKSLDKWEKMLGSAWRNIMIKSEEMTKLELIQNVAEVRCCLVEATRCIDDIFKKKDLLYDVTAKADDYISFAVRMCSENNGIRVLQEYVIKTACLKYGSDWFHLVKENDIFQNLIPYSLHEAKSQNYTDYWSLVGEAYTMQKSALYKSPNVKLDEIVPRLLRQDEPHARLARILSLMMWMHKKDDDVKEQVVEQLNNHSDHGTIFFKYLINLHATFIPALRVTELVSDQQLHMLHQLITVTVAMVTSKSHMMDGFMHMLTRPSVVENMFLPGMPESPFFSIPTEMRRHGQSMLYKCPNGHVYAIGNCTRPVVTAVCFDCGATIGGTGCTSAPGNQRYGVQNENTQVGYLINEPGNNVVDAADRISKQGSAVIQFLVHTCLLIGLENEQQAVLGMIKKQTKQDAVTYLVQQLLNNMQALSEALARNMDESVMVLNEIIFHLFNQRQGPTPPDWSTLDRRRQWETMFRETHLLPIFQNLDTVVRNAQGRIHSAEEHCNLALYRLIHDVGPFVALDANNLEWADPILWMHVQHSTSAHLLQYLGDNSDGPEGVLRIILDSTDLQLVKYLEPVLQLQSILIQKYQNEVDMKDTDEITFKQFERDGGHSHRELMDTYFAIWNKLFNKLKAKFPSEFRLRSYFVDINMLSPISYALPSTRGRGLCAKTLSEYLIDLQNDFLTKCKQEMKSDESLKEEEIPQLFHSHFVCVDKEEDLLPLIHMHTKYDIVIGDQGRHHQIAYNIDALEKQAREKFVMYKKLIAKQTLPMIQYPQDIGIGSDWDKVLANTPQQPLSAKLMQDVDGVVSRVTSADVCEGVRTLTHAISFLAKVQSDPKQYLYEFLEKDLLLSTNRLTVIPKSVQIVHCLALYNRLLWHKSVLFVLRGLNPYKDALTTVERITSKEVLENVEEAFKHSNVVLLQQRLSEMLINVPPHFDADWSLTEIFPDFAFIGDDGSDDSWYSRLPEEICLKHASHLFSLAVTFSNGYAN